MFPLLSIYIFNNNKNNFQYGSRFRGVCADPNVSNLPLPAILPVERLIPRDPQKPDFVKTFYRRRICENILWKKTKDKSQEIN